MKHSMAIQDGVLRHVCLRAVQIRSRRKCCGEPTSLGTHTLALGATALKQTIRRHRVSGNDKQDLVDGDSTLASSLPAPRPGRLATLWLRLDGKRATYRIGANMMQEPLEDQHLLLGPLGGGLGAKSPWLYRLAVQLISGDHWLKRVAALIPRPQRSR
jgi:hypothetical protein